MKKIVVIFCLILGTYFSYGQFLTPRQSMELAPNIVFVEASGVSEFYSLNYESLFLQRDWIGLSTRIGASVYPKRNESTTLDFPFLLTVLLGHGPFAAELGGGTRLHFTPGIKNGKPNLIPVGSFGIRYHPMRRGGVFVKLVYTPNYKLGEFGHGVGVAIGLAI